jgi:hypothetical protein
MRRFYASLVYASLAVAAVAALGGLAPVVPAHAAPPTVTPSPGLLQEQREGRTYHEPAVRYSRPVSRRHVKRIHRGAH